MIRHRLLSGCALGLFLMSAAGANAQDAREPERSGQASETPSPAIAPATRLQDQPGDATSLEEIVVTARKVSENQQTVPISVTAYSGDQLEQQGALRVKDVALLTPGFYAKDGNTARSAPVFAIRGQVQADTLATLDPSVGTYVDGYYWARAYGANGDLLDIQSVQTLRGPQGTLFGRNTTGGALLIQTNDPTFDGVNGLLSATYGRFNERELTGVLNVPLIEDRLAVRGALKFRARDGYIENTFDGDDYDNAEAVTGRLKLLYTPNDVFSVVLSAEYFRADDKPQPYRLGYISPLAFAPPGSPSPFTNGLGVVSYGLQTGIISPADFGALFGGNPGPFVTAAGNAFDNLQGVIATARTDDYPTNVATRNYAETQTYTGTATLETGVGTLKFITGYRDIKARSPFDVDGTIATVLTTTPLTGREFNQELEQYSAELQLTGTTLGGALDYATGVTYFNESGSDGSEATAIPGVNPSNPNISDGFVDNDSLGVYGQVSWHVTDALTFTGGLRYSDETKGIELHNRFFDPATGAFACSLTGATPAPDCRSEREDSFSSLSYTAGVDYQITPDLMIFAKTSKGFRSGGQNLRSSGQADVAFLPFEPEIAYSQEVGLKSEFFDRRLRVNLSGYYTEVEDIQRTLTLSSATAVVTRVGNAGKLRVYGGEFEMSAIVFPGLQVSATAGFVEAKYLEYFDGVRDRRSDRIAYVPSDSATFSATYNVDTGIGPLTVRGDYIHTGEIDFDPYNEPTDPNNDALIAATHAGPSDIFNARATLELDNGVEVALFGRNLTDRRDVTNGLIIAAPIGYALQHRREPRTFGISATYRFGS